MIFREKTFGEVRIILGDARRVIPFLETPDVVLTDPPYGMGFRSNHRNERYEALAGDANNEALAWACGLPAKHSKYIFCRWDNLSSIPKPRSLITWVKNNWSMGDLDHEHARQTEVAAFYPGPDHFFPSGRPQDVIKAPRTNNEHHPTEKPVPLMSAFLSWTSGTVFDPFAGSGSTLVACAKAGRAAIGIEIEPKYFDIAVRRISDAVSRPDMFVEAERREAVQEAMFDEGAAS